MARHRPPPTPDPNHAIKQAVRGGARTFAVAQFASQLVSLGSLAVLYRLIGPDDYGLLGMVLPVLMFLRIFATLGLHVSLVQQDRLSPGEASSLFWLTLVFGVATAAVTVLMAPAVARFFGEERLGALTIGLAGTAIAVALGAQHLALLERHLMWQRLAASRLIGQAAGAALAIPAAWAGWGVWALVVQQYAELIVLAAVAWIVCPWRPMAPGRGESVRQHLGVGGYFAASSMLLFLSTHIDKVLLGRLAGAHALGLYGQAFQVMIRPVYLVTTPLNGILLASLSRTATDGHARADLVRASYRLVAILLFPVGVGLALIGRRAMLVLGGPDWSDAGPILSVLSLAILGQGFFHLTVPILSATGRTDRLFRASLGVPPLLFAACGSGWWLGDRAGHAALGMACGYVVALLIPIIAAQTIYALRSARLAPARILGVVIRPAGAALVMGVVVLVAHYAVEWIASPPDTVSLILDVAVGVLVYGWLARDELRWLVSQWKPSGPMASGPPS